MITEICQILGFPTLAQFLLVLRILEKLRNYKIIKFEGNEDELSAKICLYIQYGKKNIPSNKNRKINKFQGYWDSF